MLTGGLKATSSAKAGDLLWIEEPFCATDVFLRRLVVGEDCLQSWKIIASHRQAHTALMLLHACLFQKTTEDLLQLREIGLENSEYSKQLLQIHEGTLLWHEKTTIG